MELSENKDVRRLYGDLAWTWPIISPPEEYADETGEIIELINKYAKIPVHRVLNLGCGGGHNDFTLKKYYKIISADFSEDMLALARKLNPEIKYLIGDMRSVGLGEQFEAVTVFDSINYMLTTDDLRAAFQNVYEHLLPGGVFVTYIEEWTEKFQQNKTTHLKRCMGEIEIIFVENYYDPDPNDTWYEGNMIYLIRRAGKLTIETDYHILGLFPLATWLDLLKEVGFEAYQQPSTITNGAGDICPSLIGIRP